MKILVTGAAGFIGFHLTKRLVEDGHNVIGIDSISSYYDPTLKVARLSQMGINTVAKGLTQGLIGYKFMKTDINNRNNLEELFSTEQFEIVINLAAQAGVRYALEDPESYINSNLNGMFNILEFCKSYSIKHFVFASSSSVYGLNEKTPFSEHDNTDHPISLYAATKKSNELLAHAYSNLFNLPVTGLRFFTVYGPWGRPDMATFKFTKSILSGEEIEVYGHGEMYRDFTYIDDIIEGVVRIIPKIPEKNSNWDATLMDPASSSAPYRILNIGRGKPVKVVAFIEAIEMKLKKKAKRKYLSMQPGDVYQTYADTKDLEKLTGYTPKINLEEGLNNFVDWYLDYYKIKI